MIEVEIQTDFRPLVRKEIEGNNYSVSEDGYLEVFQTFEGRSFAIKRLSSHLARGISRG